MLANLGHNQSLPIKPDCAAVVVLAHVSVYLSYSGIKDHSWNVTCTWSSRPELRQRLEGGTVSISAEQGQAETWNVAPDAQKKFKMEQMLWSAQGRRITSVCITHFYFSINFFSQSLVFLPGLRFFSMLVLNLKDFWWFWQSSKYSAISWKTVFKLA